MAEPADVPLNAMADRLLMDAGVEMLWGRPGDRLYERADAISNWTNSELDERLSMRFEKHFGVLSEAMHGSG